MKINETITSQEESGFAALFRHATIGILIAGKDGRIETVNPMLKKLFGYEDENLLGRPIEDLIPIRFRKQHVHEKEKFFSAPVSRPMGNGLELFALHKDGHEFPVEISLTYFQQQESLKAVAFINDITERVRAKNNLDQLQRNTNLIIQNTPSAVAMFDKDMRYLMVSKRWLSDYQLGDQNIIGLSHYDVFPNMPEKWKALHKRCLAGEVLKSEEDAFPRWNGRTDWIKWEMNPWYKSSGEVGGIILFSEVITEQKESRDALRKSEDRYKKLYEGINESFIVYEPIMDDKGEVIDLRLLEVNPVTEKLLGKPRKELIGKSTNELVGPVPSDLASVLKKIIQGKSSLTEEIWDPKFNRWFLTHSYLIEKNIVASMSMDITARKNAEMELEKESKWLLFLVDALKRLWHIRSQEEGLKEILSTAIELLHAEKGNIQLVNPKKNVLQIAEQKGFGKEFLKHFKEVNLDTNSVCSLAFRDGVQVVVEDVQRESWFAPHVEFAKRENIHGIQSTPVFNHKGEIIAIVSTHSKEIDHFNERELRRMELYARYAGSFLERVGYEEEIAAMNLKLEGKVANRTRELLNSLEREQRISETKSRFVSIASHEFRTPLSTILSSVFLVQKYTETNQPEKLDKHLNKIIASVNSLTEILNDFLSLDKLEQGKITTEKLDICLDNLLKEIVDEIETICKKNQKIIYSYTGMKNAMIDAKILRNILLNLLSNAIKYSEKDIELSVKAMPDYILLQVRDHGIGIPTSEQDKIFNEFFRASNANDIQGTGLGLNIVSRYVSLLKGTVIFSSEENRGTTFTVSIPNIR